MLVYSLMLIGFTAAAPCTTAGTQFHSNLNTTDPTDSNCVAASTGCDVAYSDLAGGTPTSGAIVGDCIYCATGYTDVSAGTTANSPATSDCKFCISSTSYGTSISTSGLMSRKS